MITIKNDYLEAQFDLKAYWDAGWTQLYVEAGSLFMGT